MLTPPWTASRCPSSDEPAPYGITGTSCARDLESNDRFAIQQCARPRLCNSVGDDCHLIQSQPRVYAMDGPDKLKLRMELPDAASRLRTARGWMQLLKTG